MEALIEQLGICSTCNHLEACTSRKSWKGPVTFCEEFDDYLPVETQSLPIERKTTVTAPNLEIEKHQGLCVNCELRETCTLPRPEGGKWHCEEYE